MYIFVHTKFVCTMIESTEIAKNTVVGMLKAGNKSEEYLNNTLKPFEISLQQFNVLRILRGRKGKAANLNTVQQRMIHKMSNTSRLIDKLIEKKLVEREICPDNRRKIEIFITNRGLNLLNDLDNKIQMTEAEILKPLSIDDQKILRNLINKITLNN